MKKTLLTLSVASILVGCGGGGSSSSPAPETTYCEDGIVNGVKYKSNDGITAVTFNGVAHFYKLSQSSNDAFSTMTYGYTTTDENNKSHGKYYAYQNNTLTLINQPSVQTCTQGNRKWLEMDDLTFDYVGENEMASKSSSYQSVTLIQAQENGYVYLAGSPNLYSTVDSQGKLELPVVDIPTGTEFTVFAQYGLGDESFRVSSTVSNGTAQGAYTTELNDDLLLASGIYTENATEYHTLITLYKDKGMTIPRMTTEMNSLF